MFFTADNQTLYLWALYDQLLFCVNSPEFGTFMSSDISTLKAMILHSVVQLVQKISLGVLLGEVRARALLLRQSLSLSKFCST